jgi:endoglucanase
MVFEIKKGVNISHWLSQSERRGKERRDYFTHEDIERIVDLGFDHIRLPIDEVQLWNENGTLDTETADLLNTAIYWCDRQSLRTVVDLHILKSHSFNDKEVPRLFTDQSELLRFAALWAELSYVVQEWSNEKTAYEILNEPVARDPQDWNRVSGTIFSQLRKKEPDRTIILGSNWFSMVNTFDVLDVPSDENIILTFHYYLPMLLTHYKASWMELGKYDGPINYPGYPIVPEIFDELKEPLKSTVAELNVFYDRNKIIEDLHMPLEKRKQTGKPLYCGEFGVIRNVAEEIRRVWYNDIVSVFNEYNISFCHWDYRGIFGILDENRKGTGILSALLS